jgi:predicted RNA-binding protein (virulence factor B family)
MENITIGVMNTLWVARVVDIGFFLAVEGEDEDVVLLPNRYAPNGLDEGDEIEVFVYADSEDRLLATTETPLAMVGQVAHLRVSETNPIGAFLDWDLPKDLLLPYGEQKGRPKEGDYCSVFVYKDKYADRVVATMRLNRHLNNTPPTYKPGQAVQVMITDHTDLGYKAVIEHTHWGLLYENEVFKRLHPGMVLTAYIKKLLPEGKIDLTLSPPRLERFEGVAADVLKALVNAGGFLPLHDKSPPEAIRERFGVSKRDFKAALGKLYKARRISLGGEGIRIALDSDESSIS